MKLRFSRYATDAIKYKLVLQYTECYKKKPKNYVGMSDGLASVLRAIK